MKKFASILGFKEKSILFTKQIKGGYDGSGVGGSSGSGGFGCTNVCTTTNTTIWMWVNDRQWPFNAQDNDTDQKPD